MFTLKQLAMMSLGAGLVAAGCATPTDDETTNAPSAVEPANTEAQPAGREVSGQPTEEATNATSPEGKVESTSQAWHGSGPGLGWGRGFYGRGLYGGGYPLYGTGYPYVGVPVTPYVTPYVDVPYGYGYGYSTGYNTGYNTTCDPVMGCVGYAW